MLRADPSRCGKSESQLESFALGSLSREFHKNDFRMVGRPLCILKSLVKFSRSISGNSEIPKAIGSSGPSSSFASWPHPEGLCVVTSIALVALSSLRSSWPRVKCAWD